MLSILKLNRKCFLFIVVTFFSFQYLTAAPTAPEYIRTKEWQIDKISGTEIILTAKVVFYNPNKAKAKLNSLELEIMFNDKFIGKVIQEDIVKINGKSSFDIPIRIKFDLRESGFNIGNVMGLLSNKKFIVNLTGFLKSRVFLMPFKVKINGNQEFKASDFI